MGSQLEITACQKCAWPNKGIRKALKSLAATHADRIELRKVKCLDACKNDPAVKVGSKLLAPAKPKKIRKAVGKRLA